MNRQARFLALLVLVLLVAFPALARGAGEADFLAEFETYLQDEGLSAEEAQAIVEAARTMEWSDTLKTVGIFLTSGTKSHVLATLIADIPDNSLDIMQEENFGPIMPVMSVADDDELVVLDEVDVAIWFGALDVDEVLEVVDARPDHVELVLTGRRAPSPN